MYKVEKNVPIPRKKGKGKTAFLLSLDIGDSFIFTTEKGQRNGVDNWYNLARAVGLKVKIRQIEDDQFRVWRTK